MRGGITAQALLDVWERGAGYGLSVRALWLLNAAMPEESFETLADWSIGRRDDALLTLRESLFGDHVEAVAACPNCRAQAQLDFRTANIRAPYANDVSFTLEITTPSAGLQVSLRAITTRDLLSANLSQEVLIRHCIVHAVSLGGVTVTVESVPNEFLAECAEALAAHDPQADVQLNLTCLDCGHTWDAPFDIAAFLWREVDTWGRRTLREVHLLASAYGWTEGEILRLSARRRRQYLEMVVG